MKVGNILGVVVMAAGVVIMTMAIGSVTAPETVQPSPRQSGHGLIIAEQKPDFPDCVTEDSGPVKGEPCVWDTWIRGEHPTPGRTPRYVVVRPDGGR